MQRYTKSFHLIKARAAVPAHLRQQGEALINAPAACYASELRNLLASHSDARAKALLSTLDMAPWGIEDWGMSRVMETKGGSCSQNATPVDTEGDQDDAAYSSGEMVAVQHERAMDEQRDRRRRRASSSRRRPAGTG